MREAEQALLDFGRLPLAPAMLLSLSAQLTSHAQASTELSQDEMDVLCNIYPGRRRRYMDGGRQSAQLEGARPRLFRNVSQRIKET